MRAEITLRKRQTVELIVSVDFSIIPKTDIVPPPYTSKITRSAIIKLGEPFSGLESEKTPYKRISVTPLSDGQHFLYSLGAKPLHLRKGYRYSSTVSLLLSQAEADSALDVLGESSVTTPYGELIIAADKIAIKHLSELEAPQASSYKLSFLTPLLLSNKSMMPPSASGKLRRSISPRHKLLPTPGAIFSYLARLWNRNARPELALPNPSGDDRIAPYKIGRIADVLFYETDFNLRPLTALYDKKPGVPRKPRGVVGWVIYRVAYKYTPRVFRKLLALADYMGVGKSRGIGMGVTRVEPIAFSR